MEKIKLNKKLLLIAFTIYILLLIWVIALKYNSKWIPELKEIMLNETIAIRLKYHVNIIIKAIKSKELIHIVRLFLDKTLNFIIYVPFGIYLKFLIEDKKKCCIIILLSTITFEIIQLFSGIGSFDLFDIIFNFLGGMIGIKLYLRFRKKISDKVVNIINSLVIIIFGPVSIFAIINTILNLNLYL